MDENNVVREVFGPMMDEVPGEWRKLHIEELNDSHFSQTAIWVIYKNEMGKHVAPMGDRNGMQCFCGGSLKERDHLEGLDMDGR